LQTISVVDAALRELFTDEKLACGHASVSLQQLWRTQLMVRAHLPVGGGSVRGCEAGQGLVSGTESLLEFRF